MTACAVSYAYPTRRFTLRTVPSAPGQVRRAFPLPPQGPSVWDGSRATSPGEAPAALGLQASRPCPAETPGGRSPWGGHTVRVKPPGKAERWPLRTSNRTQPVPSPGRARQEGEGSVATESQERPRDPPPAPPRSRPRPHLPPPAQSPPGGGGQACWEAARTRLDPGPAPRGSGRAGHRAPESLEFPSRMGRTRPPAGPSRRGKPGPRLSRRESPLPHTPGRPGAPAPSRWPRPRWRPPTLGAWASRAAEAVRSGVTR